MYGRMLGWIEKRSDPAPTTVVILHPHHLSYSRLFVGLFFLALGILPNIRMDLKQSWNEPSGSFLWGMQTFCQGAFDLQRSCVTCKEPDESVVPHLNISFLI